MVVVIIVVVVKVAVMIEFEQVHLIADGWAVLRPVKIVAAGDRIREIISAAV
jgi:hypothetical protein